MHPGRTSPAPSAVQRRRDAALAGHRGDAAAARPHLRDDDPAVRASGLRALARAGDLTVGELEAALADPEPVVRMTALELAEARRDVTVAAVAARLADDDRRVVEAAAWTCGEKISENLAQDHSADSAEARRDAADAVAALVEVAGGHADPLCRESAVAALGAIADPAGLPAILAGFDDKPAVRRRAVIALAPFDGPEVDAALARAAADRDKQVRAAAAELRSAS